MSEEMHPQEAEAQAGRSMPGPDILPGAEQSPSQPVQQEDIDDCGQSLASGPIDSRTDADSATAESPAAIDESDPVEGELVVRLEMLLIRDAELSSVYGGLLLSYRKTRRERRAMRAELRQLHTEEGRVLLEIKAHLAKKGRSGQWAEFLRQTKPKPLSRTTADRWIKWNLDSQEQSQSDPLHGNGENAPQNESGAFSGGDAESQPVPSDPQQPIATDTPSANGSTSFEDVQQIVLLYRKSQAAHFIRAVAFLVAKMGFGTSHEAVFVTITEAASKLGFAYTAAIAKEGRNSVSKAINPGSKIVATGSKAT
jgi:hypothetical protein